MTLLYPELRENIAVTKAILDTVYADQSMNSTSYELHAVMVHQGQASEGHYWAYVRSRPAAVRPEEETIPPATSDTVMSCSRGGDQSGSGGPTNEKSDAGSRDCSAPDMAAAVYVPPPTNEEVWLKFNDVSVTEVRWEEVARESFGGQQNTSAYCLVYVSRELGNQWCEKGGCGGARERWVWEEPGAGGCGRSQGEVEPVWSHIW